MSEDIRKMIDKVKNFKQFGHFCPSPDMVQSKASFKDLKLVQHVP